jgi:nucleotide-binding universal stress UspA family protein
MDIRSVVVNIDIGVVDTPALRYAIDLAKTFDAQLIGFAADQPNAAYLGVDAGAVAVEVYAAQNAEIEKKIKEAAEQFKRLVPANMKQAWRAYVADRTFALLEAASLADVIVTGSTTTSAYGVTESVDLGALVLGAGRPVIVVSRSGQQAKFDRVVVGWKDTREARRAVNDALPFLQRAKQVAVITVTEGDEQAERGSLGDIVAWLAQHGVTATSELLVDPQHFGDVLQTACLERNADLLVTGGYGHNRVREWLFGGMTRSLLEVDTLNRLMSN